MNHWLHFKIILSYVIKKAGENEFLIELINKASF